MGVDGATWRVMDPLIEAGQLPAYAELAQRGCRGSMKSLWPSYSPPIWTSIATGVPPSEHGIKSWSHKVGGRARLYTSDQVRVERVWDTASRLGRRVGITNFWFTYPATPVNGYVVSDHAIPARSARQIQQHSRGAAPAIEREKLVHPRELWEQLQPVLETRTPRIAIETRADLQAEPLPVLLREDEQVVELAAKAAGDDPPDLEVLYTRAIDGAQHRFWIYYEPDHRLYVESPPGPEELERLAGVIPAVYRHADALLGEVLARLAPEDVVIVVSDHGAGAVKPHDEVTGGHGHTPDSLDGIYLMAGGPVTPGACPEEISLYDLAPTILYLLGLEVPRALPGRVALRALSPTWVAAHPVRHTGAPLERPPAPPFPAEMPEEEEAHRLAILRALGYVVD